MRNKVIYITYYTPEYEHIFKSLLEPTLKKFNLPYKAYKAPTEYSHQKNAQKKPLFIYEAIEEFYNTYDALVFLDSDAQIITFNNYFENLDCDVDIAVHYLNRAEWYKTPTDKTLEILPGTLYVRFNNNTKRLCKDWILYASTVMKHVFDGKSLHHLLTSNYKRSINVLNIPIEYCYIKTLPNKKEPHVKPKNGIIYIQHNQISREMRRKIGR